MTITNLDISVIIPVYNGDRYIQAAIESVLSQQDCTYELLIIDDGSTDGTARAIEPYRAQLRYLYQENRGVSAARNLGIEQAQGRYIAFLDADDYFLPDKLSQQLNAFRIASEQGNELGLVHSGWQRVDADGTFLSKVCPWKQHPTLDLLTWLRHKPVLPSAMMFERAWLRQVGGFDPQLAAAEDVDLVLRLAIAGCQSQWLPQVTTAYRQHGKSAMGNGMVQAQCLDILLDKTFRHPQLPPEAQLLETQIRRGTLVWAAWYLYRTGYLQMMADRLKRSYELSPQIPTVALAEWMDSFETFSQSWGESLVVDELVQSPEWCSLVGELLGVGTEVGGIAARASGGIAE